MSSYYDVKVNFTEMNARIRQLEDDVVSLEYAVNQMKKDVDDLHRTWEGPNHAAFDSKFQLRYEEIAKFTKTLNNYRKILSLVKRQYELVDEEVRSLI